MSFAFPACVSVSLCHGNVSGSQNAQWQLEVGVGGEGGGVRWVRDRQESKATLVFKYIFGLGFKTEGWKNFQQTNGLENPFVSPDTVLPADIPT